MQEPENIIVRMPNWIGDLVMATPVLTDLRSKFPNASITAMCRSPISDLLKEDGAIDELFTFSRPSNEFLFRQKNRNIIDKIRAGKFDTGILLTNSFSSAWWFWQGRVRRRIGFRGNFRSILLNSAIERREEKQHLVKTYKELLRPLGIEPTDTAPRLYLEKNEMKEAKELLFQRGYKKGNILIGINPGAAYGSAKCWPPERYRALAVKLVAEESVHVVFFGDGSTQELVKQICQGLPEKVINLSGVTSIRELASLIKDCDVFVTNDSGPMHIAAAFQVPMIALFGSTDPELTGPYGQEESVIHKKPSCSPCFKRVCPIDFRCMKGISVDEVVEKIREKIHCLKR